MIIRYINARELTDEKEDGSLTLGDKYICFGINFESYQGETKFIVQRDSDGYPVLFDSSLFVIVDDRIPPNWVMEKQDEAYYGKASFSLSPSLFSGDFWGLFHEGSEEAEKKFMMIVQEMEIFHKVHIGIGIE